MRMRPTQCSPDSDPGWPGWPGHPPQLCQPQYLGLLTQRTLAYNIPTSIPQLPVLCKLITWQSVESVYSVLDHLTPFILTGTMGHQSALS